MRDATEDLAPAGTAQGSELEAPVAADEDGLLSVAGSARVLACAPGERLVEGCNYGRLWKGEHAVNTTGCGHCELGSPQGGEGENGGEGRELHLV
jgi:hypothetical protein